MILFSFTYIWPIEPPFPSVVSSCPAAYVVISCLFVVICEWTRILFLSYLPRYIKEQIVVIKLNFLFHLGPILSMLYSRKLQCYSVQPIGK